MPEHSRPQSPPFPEMPARSPPLPSPSFLLDFLRHSPQSGLPCALTLLLGRGPSQDSVGGVLEDRGPFLHLPEGLYMVLVFGVDLFLLQML